MPDEQVIREEIHHCRIEMRGFRRSDGLYEVEGRVTDRKPRFPLAGFHVTAMRYGTQAKAEVWLGGRECPRVANWVDPRAAPDDGFLAAAAKIHDFNPLACR